MSARRDRLLSVVEREFRTAVRTRALVALSLAFAAVSLGLAWTGGAASYVATALSLLTPIEVLVPALAFAFAYRSVLEDRRSGELEVLRTYPLGRWTYVLGVYLGRGAALLSVVVATLLAAGLLSTLAGGPANDVIASHSAGDSPLLYLRFVALTALFAAVALAAVVAVSAVAGGVRTALALGLAVAVALALGLDLGILAGLSGGWIPEGGLAWLLALSPASAFRGLTLELVVGPVATPAASSLAPVLNALGLFAWLGGALAVGTYAVWR